MEKCGKKEFTKGEIEMMRQFCSHGGKADPEKMKQFMENCGCQIEESGPGFPCFSKS